MSETTADAFEATEETAIEKVVEPQVVETFEKMTDEQKAEVGHGLEQEIVGDSQQVMARYLRIGRNLYIVSKHSLYRQLGYETFDQWRAQPEMNLARATCYALMKVFEVFVDKLKVDSKNLDGIDWSKLYSLTPFVTSDNVEEFIEKARSLSRSDLQREVAVMRGRLKGKTEAEAEATVALVDIVREACPMNCGAKCPIIDADHDAAVESFRKFLGRWKSLSARIRNLFGTDLKPTAKRKHGDVPPETDPADAPGVGESSPLPHGPERP